MSGTIADWPFGCPASWTEKPAPSVLRTEMEDGYPKVRRLVTKDWSVHEASWPLLWSQVAAFRSFLSIECAGGALPFRMTDPITGEAKLFRFVEPPTLATDASRKPVASVTGRLELVFS